VREPGARAALVLDRIARVFLGLNLQRLIPSTVFLLMPQNSKLEAQIEFLVEVDKLKSVLRRNYAIHGDRRENSAEHSWHVALFAMVLAEHSNEPVDINRVVRMLVIHDIVEVDAGDTFIYDDTEKETQVVREERAADRLFGLLPQEQGELFRDLWDEFEAAATPEAKFAKAIDRFAAALHNYKTHGRGWSENGIKRDRVLAVNEYVRRGSAALWDKIQSFVNSATKEGFLQS
jgi:putative hydrolases of HD superfamily